MTWKIKDLRNMIPKSHENYKQINEVLDSISRLLQIYVYHNERAYISYESLKEMIDEDELDFGRYIEFVFREVSSDERIDFDLTRLEHQANIISAISTVRSAYEYFCILVNILILNNEIEIKQCNIYTVTRKLTDSPLKIELEQISQSEWFQYISHFNNIIKHNYLIKEQFTYDLEENRSGSSFDSFKYIDRHGNYSYEKRWSIDVLKGVLSVKNKVILLGELLNAQYKNLIES